MHGRAPCDLSHHTEHAAIATSKALMFIPTSCIDEAMKINSSQYLVLIQLTSKIISHKPGHLSFPILLKLVEY